ncbi:hypothetical protein KORDIASMS9_00114 [Kordia sp. SMS9]|uniref:hypothetical protein n=1 Tax=Kordia sp. SMS9 TaxID=2282170 RepID=UPI000E104008|nr:hypothetical protein [Kordia sp. SMS9]AXG67932.1 hypothetical protein KORDIASMS9_00114 [Kordia sp. SMS9]
MMNMKNYITISLTIVFAFAKVHAQEFPKPEMASPESTFYTYLDNERISDPTKYNGKVKKVVRTFTQYEQGYDEATTQKVTMLLNANGALAKTITRTYTYGIEDSKEEINHLEAPKADIKKEGNRIVKTIKNELNEDVGYEYDEKGNDKYVYEHDRLIAFYNNNDSISYNYDKKNRLITIKAFESLILEEFDEEENDTRTLWRSTFEDRALEKMVYMGDLPAKKIIYDKFGEVIDIYKKTYTYSEAKLLKQFQTEYKRYLFDYYEDSLAIDQQKYEEFPRVETNDSIQTGTFQYSKTNKITAYHRTKGAEKETYKITYDTNDQMYLVVGTLTFYQRGKLVSLNIEYEYLYDNKGNPKTIRSYYYLGGEKILDKQTSFEIVYY